MADGSSSFFKNKWGKYHITAIDNLLVHFFTYQTLYNSQICSHIA